MTNIKVFHCVHKATDPLAIQAVVRSQFMLTAANAAVIWTGADPDFNYREVAVVVQCDDLDHAYERTNSIDRPWTQNQDVIPIAGRHRSTSVGDVMIKESNGTIWFVAPCGFQQINSSRANAARGWEMGPLASR